MANLKIKGIAKLSALKILLLSFVIGVVGYAGSLITEMDSLTHLMLGWDIFCLTLISLHWYMFANTSITQIDAKAQIQDETRSEIFAIVVISTFAGLLAVILLLINKDSQPIDLIIAISGMFLSWFLVHTTFCHTLCAFVLCKCFIKR